ncbi:MAG: bis(5'-nucleosyl)-tetraphosphatase (symmetrical) YqeK [Candidatus Margulisiibacteriota bacterium]
MDLREKLRSRLSPERFAHSERVAEEAVSLAEHYGLDTKKAELAGLLHDCSRFLDRKGMLARARELGFDISALEEFEPKLLHAKLSAFFCREEYGVSVPEILSAVSKHTLGSVDMSGLDKVVYLADHIESERDYSGVHRIRELAYKDMDEAIICSCASMISSLLEKGLPVSEEGVRTRNEFLIRKHGQKKELGK